MKIHFIGCNGVSMKELMRLEKRRGNLVSGSDLNLHGHREENVLGADLVVYTNAVKDDNIELIAARKLKIPCIERAQLLGELAGCYEKVIAVSGAHGKTTTTGMIGACLNVMTPTIHIGGELVPFEKKQFSYLKDSDVFVTEACEYRRSFLNLKPYLGIVLNIDLDHTDYYRDMDDVCSAFQEFAHKSEILLVCSDDFKALRLNANKRKYTFGFNAFADYRAVNLSADSMNRYSFDVLKYGVFFSRFSIRASGRHNVYNGLCAIAAGDIMGLDAKNIRQGLSVFNGVERRFEQVGSLNGAAVISDYAHHPKEIKASVENARKCAQGKLYAVFQPHTYSRTKSLLDGFCDSLTPADNIVILPIFAAREAPIAGVTSLDIVLRLNKAGRHAVYTSTFCETAGYLETCVKKQDLVLFLGAGDVDSLARTCGNSAAEICEKEGKSTR